MSRHRNVRGMDYGDDYEGYDDVYGHSVEEDYGVSPSTAEQFIFHRSLQHHQLASFLEEGEEDLQQAEGDQTRRDSDQPLNDSRNFKKPELSDIEEAQLQSCLEEIRNVVGDAIPEHVLVETALAHKFNFEKALNAILDHQESGGGQQKSNNNMETQTGVCDFMILRENEKRENEKKEMNISTRPNDHSDPDGLLTERNRKTSPSGTMQVGGLADGSKEVQKASSNVLVAPLSNLVGVRLSPSSLSRCKAVASSNLVSSVPLSALAASHLSSSPAASGASRGRGPLSLSQLAGSRLDATKASRDRDVLTGSLTGLSLRDLSQRSLSSTPPRHFPVKQNLQTNINSRGGHTGEEDHRGISLSSLASSHLSSNPLNLKPSGTPDFGNKTDRFSTQSLAFDSRIGSDLKSIGLGNLVGGLGATVKTKVPGAIRPMDGGLQHGHPGTVAGSSFLTPGMSISSLASSHLTSNLSRSQEKSTLGFGTGGSTAGISLSDLATTHLSSTPPSQLFIGVALESRHKHQSMVSTSPAGSSLFRLATNHLSQAPSTSTAFALPSVRDTHDKRTTLQNSPVKMEQNTSEWFQTISSHQPLSGFEPARFEAPPGLRPLTYETVPPSEDELTPRVHTPPGFQSRESIKMESTSSGLTTNIETQDTSVIQKIQGLPKFKHSAKQSKSLIFSKPSVFARTLCAEYINQSPQRMKVASCILNKLHSKPIKHRQFSYRRQKSWTESPADNKEEVVVFDFSTPSPDDVVKQRQSGAFGSVHKSKGKKK